MTMPVLGQRSLGNVKNPTAIRRGAALLVLVVALVLLAWGYWPHQNRANSLLLSPEEMLPTQWPSGTPPDALPAVTAMRRLELSYPLVLRVGDGAVVHLALVPAAQEDRIPAGSSSGQPAPVEVSADEYTVIAEARLDLAGIDYGPPGQTNQAMLAGRPVNFAWQVRPGRPGEFEGVAWLHLNYLAPDGQPVARQVISAQRIRIRSVSFWGMSGNLARLLGSAGLVLGVVFGLDGIALWALHRLQRV